MPSPLAKRAVRTPADEESGTQEKRRIGFEIVAADYTPAGPCWFELRDQLAIAFVDRCASGRPRPPNFTALH